MPLKNFFEDQLKELRKFLDTPGRAMQVVQHDPDIKQMLQKLLVAIEGDENSPHLLVALTTPFTNTDQFFCDLLSDLVQQNESHREELAKQGVELPSPLDESVEFPPPRRFKRYFSDVAESLPDAVGAIALILDPDQIENEPDYRKSMEYLAAHTRSDWAKYIVLDRRNNPILGEITQSTEKAGIQVFNLSPEKIEKQVKDDLASGRLSPQEKRQYAAMVGAFAFANRNYDEAKKSQLEVLRTAQQEGAPAEVATAHYNLGNTHLAEQQFAQAEEQYNLAAGICLEHQINPLLAMVLVNLGVATHRQGRIDQSLESFDVSRRTFKAMNIVPGEAYALDCKAAVLALEKRNEDAEQTWRDALALYDGITNEVMADVREGGRKDLVDKLVRFFESTDQKQKAHELKSARVLGS